MLHDQENALWGVDNLKQLNNIQVTIAFQNFDLTRNALNISYLYDALLLKNLYRDLLTRYKVKPELYLAKSALADGITKNIFANNFTTAIAGSVRST